jgi:hypothetical protein
VGAGGLGVGGVAGCLGGWVAVFVVVGEDASADQSSLH